MKSALTTALVLLCVIVSGSVVAAQIENFDYNNDTEARAEWIVSGNDASQGGSAEVYASLSEKQEGLSAIRFEYNYSGNPWYQMQITKTYSTPFDLSAAKNFKMWVYMDGTASTDLIWFMRLYTSTGHVWRIVDWTEYTETGWIEMEFDLSDMETEKWIYGPTGAYTDNADITETTKIEIILQQRAASAGGTANFYFDDLRYETTNDELTEEVIDDFNYANTPSLQAVWSTFAQYADM